MALRIADSSIQAIATIQGSPPADELGYHGGQALAIAHSQRLGHLVGVNGYGLFAAPAAAASHRADAALTACWPERRCANDGATSSAPTVTASGPKPAPRSSSFRTRHRHRTITRANKLNGYSDLAIGTGM